MTVQLQSTAAEMSFFFIEGPNKCRHTLNGLFQGAAFFSSNKLTVPRIHHQNAVVPTCSKAGLSLQNSPPEIINFLGPVFLWLCQVTTTKIILSGYSIVTITRNKYFLWFSYSGMYFPNQYYMCASVNIIRVWYNVTGVRFFIVVTGKQDCQQSMTNMIELHVGIS